MSGKSIYIAASVVVAAAFIIRLWNLDTLPRGANQDELLRGYDAYALLRTGADHRGKSWPLYFEGYSDIVDNPPPLFTYLTIPWVGVFGLTLWAVRFSSAILGAIAVAATIHLAYVLTRRSGLAIIAGALLAVSPWHVFLSRFGCEQITLSTFSILGASLFLDGARRRSVGWITASAAVFGIGAYGYSPVRMFVPLLLVILVWSQWENIRELRWRLLIPVGVLATLVVPVFWFVVIGPGLGRFQEIGVFRLGSWPAIAYANYSKHFVPVGLHFPHLSTLESLLLIAGFALLINREIFFKALRISDSTAVRKVLLGWLITAPIPAAITLDAPHFGRSSSLLPVPQVLGALVIAALWAHRRQLWASGAPLRAVTFMLVLFFSFALFHSRSPYAFFDRQFFKAMFYPGLSELVRLAPEHSAEDSVITTTRVEQPFMTVAFFEGWNPRRRIDRVYLRNGWQHVPEMDNYRFCPPVDCAKPGDFVIARPEEIGERAVLASAGDFVAVVW